MINGRCDLGKDVPGLVLTKRSFLDDSSLDISLTSTLHHKVKGGEGLYHLEACMGGWVGGVGVYT